MRNRMKTLSFLAMMLLGALGLFISCTKEVDSKPQFIFKPAPNKEAAAMVNGKVITYSELTEGVENDLYEAEMKVHEIKMNRLKALVLKKFMEADPAYKGDNDKFLNEQIAKTIKITEKQIMAFAKERNIPKENLNDQLKERIKSFLENESKQTAIDNWIATKTKKNPVEVYLTKPNRPVKEVTAGDAPFIGGADAKVTIVEFSDFQCPFCARGATLMTDLKKKYGNKIKVAFKNFPLPFHNHAKKAAEAGLCAHEQKADSFWKLHDKMFADQAGLNRDGLIAKAVSVGLNKEKFTTCLDSGKFAKSIDSDIEEGQKVGVKSTPTFFVNGKMVNGAQPIEVFSELIDEELAK
ncbi:MAG: DsbA family protein [Bacteriovoracaceae bacterium]|nr:DsbA family protein [Bacteriovoracaceae bacterium]